LISFVIMPVVFRIRGYRFFFFSNEGNEPKHIHVEKADGSAKLWLIPAVKYEYSYGFTGKEQNEILKITEDRIETIKTAWNEYFKR